MNINIFVSCKCFCYCKGCYSYSREERCKHTDNADIIAFLDFMNKNGLKKITLCGGDPLMRVDIIELLEALKNMGYQISLDTMGTSLLGDVIKNDLIIAKKIEPKTIAKLVDMIGIPIDGSNSQIANLFRCGTDNIINHQLSICDLLNKCSANICINTVAHKGNLSDAKNLAKLISNLSYIKKWQVFQFIPSGKIAEMNRKYFEITEDEFLQFKTDVLDNFSGDKDKIEFKSKEMRNNIYLMIDNAGNAWIPSSLQNNSINDKRNLLGNIKNKNDWEIILQYWKKTNMIKESYEA